MGEKITSFNNMKAKVVEHFTSLMICNVRPHLEIDIVFKRTFSAKLNTWLRMFSRE